MLILGIETSCDETAAAVVKDGFTPLSSIVSSQVDIHHPFGGVVPELASRKHIEAIVPVVHEALENAGVHASQIQGVAATQGPGLVGSLLVGFSFAKAFAYSMDLPWIGVNHLEGHINSVFLEPDPPPFPFVVLLVSGGHTAIYHVTSHTDIELMGQTRDDAAGEAFDKVSKMLGLGYPGGRVVGEMAAKGDPGKVKFKRPYLDKKEYDFSFSGIKTGVNRYIQSMGIADESQIRDIAAGFQEAVVDVLSYKLLHAARQRNCDHTAIVGGVAANTRLRDKVTDEASRIGLEIHIPSPDLCGDNAAMIASVGFHYLKRGILSDLRSDVYSRVKI
ncbi:MAG: tRNA (adenosine(37)-N6)-threonylcarbamoyltransferase complex transferase subunit TsaD [Deltaproteobacteria bacterium]|nr:tRNA (adenosine(37)-N6)-threonylcarbamoyltransferase complex transferase subunit TsaD [Deltaproteobacteria bacterium]